MVALVCRSVYLSDWAGLASCQGRIEDPYVCGQLATGLRPTVLVRLGRPVSINDHSV